MFLTIKINQLIISFFIDKCYMLIFVNERDSKAQPLILPLSFNHHVNLICSKVHILSHIIITIINICR